MLCLVAPILAFLAPRGPSGDNASKFRCVYGENPVVLIFFQGFATLPRDNPTDTSENRGPVRMRSFGPF